MQRIAIIGAGMAGLTVAHILKDVAEVVLFEKSRSVGGRMATRYADPFHFDHGAQFCTAKSSAFQQFLQPLLKQNAIARWDACFVELEYNKVKREYQWGADYPHYVGTPGMNAIGKYLAQGLTIYLNTHIKKIIDHHHKWQIVNDKNENLGAFEWVITTAPPAQSVVFFPEIFSHFNALNSNKMEGCFSLMLGFEKALPLQWDAALVRGADISWISVNSSKPGRKNDFTLIVNSSNAWAEKHINSDHEVVKSYLCDATSNIIGYDVTQANHIALHRWRYANIHDNPLTTESKPLMIDRQHKLAACGDWLDKGRIEAAFSAGYTLAHQIKSNIEIKP